VPRLSFDELFERRIRTKDSELREFLEKAEQVRREMPPSYDRDEDMVQHIRVLLNGGKTLKGAHSESLGRIAEHARRHLPNHKHTSALEDTARQISAHHYSRMR
jgi:hypothetical protein